MDASAAAGAPHKTATWADAIAASQATEGTGSTPAQDPPKVDNARMLDVLRAIGKPAELDDVLKELNANAKTDDYVPGGVAKSTLEALVESGLATKKEEGTRTLFALPSDATPAAPIVTDTPPAAPTVGMGVEARAAVVSILARNRAYPVGGWEAGEPEPPAGNGFDVFQIAYVCHVVREQGAAAPIAILPELVMPLVEGLDRDDMAGLEVRVNNHLAALMEHQFVTNWPISGVDGQDAKADGSDAAGWLFALTNAGREIFQARGAIGVAEKTLPAGPSVEEQIQKATEPLIAELSVARGELSLALTQRDTALHTNAKLEDLVAKYRAWFLNKGLDQPDDIVATRARGDRKILKDYAIQVTIDLDQHWRIMDEKAAAKIALAQCEEAASASKESWKSKIGIAQALVSRLEALSEIRPGTPSIITKNVFKEVEDGRIAVYSADEHDYGQLILYEEIPRGVQRTIPGTGGEPAPATPGKPISLADPLALAGAVAKQVGGTASVENGVATVSVNVDGRPPAELSLAARVLGLLRAKGSSSEDRIAADLGVEIPQVIQALADLDNQVGKEGSYWKAEEEKVEPKPEATAPKGEGTALTLSAIRSRLEHLFETEPVSRTGLLYGKIAGAYAKAVNIPDTTATAKLVLLAVDDMLRTGALSQGEGGEDRLIWSGKLPDPRMTNADRAGLSAPVMGPTATGPAVTASAPPVMHEEGDGEDEEDDEDDEDEEDAPASAEAPDSSPAPAQAAPKKVRGGKKAKAGAKAAPRGKTRGRGGKGKAGA